MSTILNAGRAPMSLILAASLLHGMQCKRNSKNVLSMFANMFLVHDNSGHIKATMMDRLRIIVADVIGIVLVLRLYRKFLKFQADARRKSLLDLKDDIGSWVINILKMIPGAQGKIKDEFNKIESSIEKSLKPVDREKNTKLPEKGIPRDQVLNQMMEFHRVEKYKWEDGYVSGAVYHGGNDNIELQSQAMKLFNVSNPLHPDVWPSVMKFESEIIAMTANLLNGGDTNVCGLITSGGTESIIMSVKSHRQWARERGIHEPEIIACDTAHAAIDKACDMLGIKLIKIPTDPVTLKADVKQIKNALTPDTIMIYASAPQYPHGIIDPVEEVSDIAVKHGCGLHVDCCLGGFVLPFAKKLGYPIPKFDFELPGVTSISVDTHKYGYSAKGTSVILYRNNELRRHNYFTFPNWPGGLYVTPGMPGSRPGALSAACWAGMMSIGEDGYLDAVDKIMKGQQKIKKAVEEIDGIELMGDPIAMIVALGSKKVDIYKIADAMHKKQWLLNSLQRPRSIHICVTLRNVLKVDQFIHDLKEATRQVMSDPNKLDKDGKAPVYGMAEAMPAGPITEMLLTYTDVVLKV